MRIAALAARPELAWLHDALSDLTIRYDWPDCSLSGTSNIREWTEWLSGGSMPEIIICDVVIRGAITGLREARRQDSSSLVVLITNADIPPTEYVQPDILPYALLWPPLKGTGNRELLRRVLDRAYSESGAGNEQLSVQGRRESRWLPLREILYFEAREKRVYAHLLEQEIPLNETMAKLEERFPERFIRCHKGFLVNREHISRVDWTTLTVVVAEKLQVPISRGYRTTVKEKFNDPV